MTLAITSGEPAGIGPELCAKIALQPLPAPVVVIGDATLIAERAAALSLPVKIQAYDRQHPAQAHTPGVLVVESIAFANRDCLGIPDTANASALLQGLDRAVDGCLSGEFAAMVTAPLQKSIINDAGIAFSGHTEYLAKRCGVTRPVMLLANDQLRVALATTHLPLRDVAAAITPALLDEVIDILWLGLKQRFAISKPRILVCGLNPHAGEGGHLGHEDDDIIRPAVERARAQGRDVVGPLPADTIFNPAAGPADAVLAMYHDQGLPVIKFTGFGEIVNVTLGLPIVRTSVDHGTALDIAGSGKANEASLLAAIALAAKAG